MNEEESIDRDLALKKAVKLFIRSNKLHRAAFRKSALMYGMHRSQHKMLMFICRKDGGLAQKEIAEAMDVSPAAITVTLNKLENAGYVVRTMSEKDSRVNLITATDKAKAIAKESRMYFESIDRTLFKDFSEEELELVAGFFQRMQNNIISCCDNWEDEKL